MLNKEKNKPSPLSPLRGSNTTRILAGIVFAVVMAGTVVVIIHQNQHVSPSGGGGSNVKGQSDENNAENILRLRRIRSHAQRDALVYEARALLQAVEKAEERIDRVARVLSRFNDGAAVIGRSAGDAAAAGSSANKGNGAANDDDDDAQHASFPLHRFHDLKKQHRNHNGNTKLEGTSLNTNATIFVGMASHRQKLCSAMVSNLFRHSAFPRRVYLGIVQIHSDNDPPCLAPELTDCQLHEFCITDHTRVREIEPSENKGLAYARYLASLMYRGQTYVMFVNVPSFMAPRWDVTLIDMHVAATQDAISKGAAFVTEGDGGVIFSTSPEDVDHTKTYPVLPVDAPPPAPATTNAEGQASDMIWERVTMSFLCRAEYVKQPSLELSPSETPGVPPRGVPFFSPVVQKERSIGTAMQPWLSLRFIFANATLLREVPFDPHLLYIERESEEDALYSARAWAAGWDAYAPSKSVVFQWKGGEEVAGTFATDIPSALLIGGKKATYQRIQYLLHALSMGSREPLIPDDVVLQEVTNDAMRYGVAWGAKSLQRGGGIAKQRPSNGDENKLSHGGDHKQAAAGGGGGGGAASGVNALEPASRRSLEAWYRYSGLDPSAYTTNKQWCNAQDG